MNSPKPHSKATPKDSSVSDSAANELMKPGPEHAQLAKNIGKWTVAYTHWHKDGVAPTTAEGTAVFTKIFDGRFIHEELQGDFQGKPFHGTGTMGYDRAAKKFVNTWYDNMGTGITSTTGTATSHGKEVVMRGMMTCATRGELQVRHVYHHESDDKFTMTMFSEHEGKESKSMEVTYTRQR
jgi:hypothetical protein